MLSKEKAREIVNTITSLTRQETVVLIYDESEKLTRFANSEIHQNVEIEDCTIRLTLNEGKRSVSVQCNTFDTDSIKALVAEAEALFAHAPEGEDEFIPTPPQNEPVERINDPRLAQNFDVNGRAAALERCFATLDADYTAAGALSLDTNMMAYGDCRGNFHYCSYNTVSFNVVVTHKDGDTGAGAATFNNSDKCGIDEAFKIAYDKAKAAIGPIFADLGAYTVVLEPEAVADLLIYSAFGLLGTNYEKGMSYAAGKMGQKIFGDNFTLRDDINNLDTFGIPFDHEGYVKQPLALFENGVLKNVLHNAQTARRAGAEPTGHAGYPSNIVMEGGDTSLEDMIKGVKRGILVTHFHYCNFTNPQTLQVTGLTRDGTFLIENGKVTTPLKNMRFTESLLEAFNNIKALGEPVPISSYGGPMLVPAAVIENFHFTSGQK